MRLRTILSGAVAVALATAIGFTTTAPAAPSMANALPPMDTSQHFRVMPLGDSITYGIGSSGWDGYRWDLARYITEVQQIGTFDYVGSMQSGQEPDKDHEGHRGWRIDQLTDQVAGWIQTYHPDLILLHAGVNDAGQGASPQTMDDRMRSLLAAILAADPDVRVIVGDLIPTWYGTVNDVESVAIQRFDVRLPTIVADAGPRVTLARMSYAVTNGLLGDGTHPDDTGYRYMAYVWWRCMGRVLSGDGIVRSGENPLPFPAKLSEICPY